MTARTGNGMTAALLLLLFGTINSGAALGQSQVVIFDDFNTDEGHFAVQPTFSGSTNGIDTTSTADRDETVFLEGTGSERLVLNDDLVTPGGTARARILSGRGVTANNTPFETTDGEDGWIGLAVKTDSPGWTVQLWLEQLVPTDPAADGNNGGVPKTVLDDNQWHIYEWNLDDFSGAEDSWGSMAGIINGSAIVGNAMHTIDSAIFRQTLEMPATATIYFDFVAKSATGSIASLLPAPANADFDGSTVIDAADLGLWNTGYGKSTGAVLLDGDADGDDVVDGRDFLIWQRQYNAPPPVAAGVPEPTAFALAAMALGLLGRLRRV